MCHVATGRRGSRGPPHASRDSSNALGRAYGTRPFSCGVKPSTVCRSACTCVLEFFCKALSTAITSVPRCKRLHPRGPVTTPSLAVSQREVVPVEQHRHAAGPAAPLVGHAVKQAGALAGVGGGAGQVCEGAALGLAGPGVSEEAGLDLGPEGSTAGCAGGAGALQAGRVDAVIPGLRARGLGLGRLKRRAKGR